MVNEPIRNNSDSEDSLDLNESSISYSDIASVIEIKTFLLTHKVTKQWPVLYTFNVYT